VTKHPSSAWVIQQLRNAFPYDSAPGYLIFDRGASFNEEAVCTMKSFGIQPKRTSFRSPWQNGVAERWVGNCRREVLDHVIVVNEPHLKRLLNEYVSYYREDRTHLALDKQTPKSRVPAKNGGVGCHPDCLFDQNEPSFGSATLICGGMLYVYGCGIPTSGTDKGCADLARRGWAGGTPCSAISRLIPSVTVRARRCTGSVVSGWEWPSPTKLVCSFSLPQFIKAIFPASARTLFDRSVRRPAFVSY
jgi:hypothetical protein